MGICHSTEATTNSAAIEPIKFGDVTSPVQFSNNKQSNTGNSNSFAPSTVTSPPSPTLTTTTNSPDTSVARLDTKNDNPIEKLDKQPAEQSSASSENSAATSTSSNKPTETPTATEEEARRRSGSNSQTTARRNRRVDSKSQQRPVTRRSSSGISRANQLFTDWTDSSPAPEIPLVDRAPRTIIITTHQPMRSSDAPLPDPEQSDPTVIDTNKPMQSVTEEEKEKEGK